MRKTVAIVIIALLLLAVISECRKRGKATPDKKGSKGKKQRDRV